MKTNLIKKGLKNHRVRKTTLGKLGKKVPYTILAIRQFFLDGPLHLFSFTCVFLIICSFQIYAQTTKGTTVINTGEKRNGDIHALIIGISKYANYPCLQYADKDAIAFYKLLLSDAFGADSNKVVLLINEKATQNRVDEALSNLVDFVKEGDRVFFYFSGHGGVEGLTTSKRGFLLTYETSQSNLRLSSYRIEDLNAILGELATANKAEVYLITDACHSGKVEEAKYKGLSPVNEYIGRITYGTSFLSCAPDELSLEGEQWGGGRGLFSYHLVNGLAGKADMDHDCIIDLNEISFYVKNRVRKEAMPNNQNPIITGTEKSLCKADPGFLKLIESSTPILAKVALKDINNKGYEEVYISHLTDGQKELYNRFITALDKSNDDTFSIESIDFADARRYYNQLSISGVPPGFEAIIRRKLIAALQDRPQQMLDSIISGIKAQAYKGQICLMAKNLEYSARLMGENHYLYDISMAKFYFFESTCYKQDENYAKNESLKMNYLKAADSAIYYADNICFLYVNRGIAKEYMHDYQGAISDYSKAIELNPKYAMTYTCRGDVRSDMKDDHGAISDYSKAIELDPKNAITYNNRGTVKSDMKDYQGAISDYSKAIELDPKDATAYSNRGNAKKAIQDYQGAISDYSKAIELDPEDAVAYTSRGITKKAMQDYMGAISDYSKAIELNPKSFSAYYNRGTAKYAMQDYQGAISDYSKAIELDPKDATAYSNRGVVKRAIQDYQGAISDYSKAIELDTQNVDSYINLGVLYFQQKNYSAAIEMTERAFNINPEEPALSDNLGYYFIEIDKYDKAIENFLKCLKIENNTIKIDAILGLSMAYYYKNDKGNAKKYFKEAKQIKPLLNKGVEGLSELEKEGYVYSNKNRETLIRMLEELK